ncbi:MAG TPA: MMPL family transporter, partial [Gemmatimonadaceae bacterium]|nr:MMPL family transporter [Gemmatimonadaceae bacterium]
MVLTGGESPERPRPGAFARMVVRRRGRVALAWALAALLLLPFAAGVERVLDVSARIDGSESAAVQRALAERFASPFARYAVLVASGLPSPDGEAGRRALARVAAGVSATPGVTRVFSWLDARDTLFTPRGGGTYLLAGLAEEGGSADALVPGLRATARALEDSLRAEYPGVALRWTGEAALNFDLRRTSAAQAQRAELRALPLTLALLVVAFGTLAAAVLPLGAGLLAIGVSLGAAALAARHLQLSILLQNVVSMLGLGLGVDYALLTVSRFREALAAGLDAEQAAAEAADRAGHTVAVSGAAVAVGFAALLTVPLNELRSVAVGGLLVTLASVLVATTLLPGVLAWLGPRVDAGRLARRHRAASTPAAAWYGWASWVARHPLLVLALFGTPVALLAWQARRLGTELPRG